MELDFQIERSILKIGRKLLAQRSDDLKRYDLTAIQSEALLFFDQNPGAMILALKEHLKISHQAARNLVERMREKGLLDVGTSAEDARARRICLSERGRNVCEELKLMGTSLGGDILSQLSAEERQVLSGMLERILASLE